MATKTASASLEERLKANPDSLAFSRVAEYFRTSGDIARAIDICDSGNRKHPAYVTGRIILGRCYMDLENFDEAAKSFSAVCELDRRNMVAMKMLADIYLRLGSREKAGDLYAQLAAMDPWNETLSRLAAQTPGSRDAGAPAILSYAPSDETRKPSVAPTDAPEDTPEDTPEDVQGDLLKDTATDIPMNTPQDVSAGVLPEVMEKTDPQAEAEADAQMAVTQEVTRVDLGIMEPVPGEKDEAVIETSENIPRAGEEAFFEATTVTGNDITDRMAMLFGEKETREKPAAEAALPLAPEPPAAVTEEAVETIEVQPVEAIPDGNTISSRIDELFSTDTLKKPAIDEAVLSAEREDTIGMDEAAGATIRTSEPASAGESEFEETMIMDALDVKDFLRKDLAEPEIMEKAGTGGDESGIAEEKAELISDAFQPSAERTYPAELIIDEKDPGGASGLKDGLSSVLAVPDDAITGDDVVRLMSGFFEGEEDKAISEVVGPETIDDFFEGTDLVVEPLPMEKVPGETEAVVAPADEKTAQVRDEDQEKNSAMPAGDDTITGDDVAKRIEGYFCSQAAGKEEPSSAIGFPVAAVEEPAATEVPAFPATGAPLSSLTEESDGEATIIESLAEDADALQPLAAKELESPEEATVVADDTLSGDDVAVRIAGMFSDSEQVREAAMAGAFPGDADNGREPDIDDTRVVDAGRPSETDVIEDTVAEGAAGIISGADIEERLEEYFHDAAEKTAGGAETLPAAPLPDEEATYPDFPKGPGAMADKKADYEETIIASAGDEKAFREPVANSTAADEEAIVETVGHMEETLDAKDPGDREETLVSEIIEDQTAVFTDFATGSVPDAPLPPPQVPLFTVENPRTLDEETISTEIPAAAAEPVEPDIPDHVLTPTLADIYLQQGQPKLALTIYRRLLEKRPDNEKLEARVKEIEKALAEGVLPVAPVEQKKPIVTTRKKTGSKSGTRARPHLSEDTRPLAGVRLKKKPKLNWKKK